MKNTTDNGPAGHRTEEVLPFCPKCDKKHLNNIMNQVVKGDSDKQMWVCRECHYVC